MDTRDKANEQLLRDNEAFVKKTQGRLERASRLPKEARGRLQSELNALRHALKENDVKTIESTRDTLDALLAEHLGEEEKSAFREYAESIGMAVLFALILRGFVVEAFKIPSGSMIPTLLIGDHLFVNKFVYGMRVPFTDRYMVRFSEPERGDVVVFTFPRKEARAHLERKAAPLRTCIDDESLTVERDFIKRVIGVPGDTVELRDNKLIINGSPLKRQFVSKETTGKFLYPHTTQELETLGEHTYKIEYKGQDRNFGPAKVKPGHIFVMGDNRDGSSDSRCWGQVPIQNVKGRAMILWWSVGDGVRWSRIGKLIH